MVQFRPFRVQLLEFLCSLIQGVHHVPEIGVPLVFHFGSGELLAEGAVEPLGPEALEAVPVGLVVVDVTQRLAAVEVPARDVLDFCKRGKPRVGNLLAPGLSPVHAGFALAGFHEGVEVQAGPGCVEHVVGPVGGRVGVLASGPNIFHVPGNLPGLRCLDILAGVLCSGRCSADLDIHAVGIIEVEGLEPSRARPGVDDGAEKAQYGGESASQTHLANKG